MINLKKFENTVTKAVSIIKGLKFYYFINHLIQLFLTEKIGHLEKNGMQSRLEIAIRTRRNLTKDDIKADVINGISDVLTTIRTCVKGQSLTDYLQFMRIRSDIITGALERVKSIFFNLQNASEKTNKLMCELGSVMNEMRPIAVHFFNGRKNFGNPFVCFPELSITMGRPLLSFKLS